MNILWGRSTVDFQQHARMSIFWSQLSARDVSLDQDAVSCVPVCAKRHRAAEPGECNPAVLILNTTPAPLSAQVNTMPNLLLGVDGAKLQKDKSVFCFRQSAMALS